MTALIMSEDERNTLVCSSGRVAERGVPKRRAISKA